MLILALSQDKLRATRPHERNGNIIFFLNFAIPPNDDRSFFGTFGFYKRKGVISAIPNPIKFTWLSYLPNRLCLWHGKFKSFFPSLLGTHTVVHIHTTILGESTSGTNPFSTASSAISFSEYGLCSHFPASQLLGYLFPYNLRARLVGDYLVWMRRANWRNVRMES